MTDQEIIRDILKDLSYMKHPLTLLDMQVFLNELLEDRQKLHEIREWVNLEKRWHTKGGISPNLLEGVLHVEKILDE